MLKNKGIEQVSIPKLDKYMKNVDNQHFSYDLLKSMYDSNPQLQAIISDFDQNSITLNIDGKNNIETDPQTQNTDTVSQMAKRAVDL